MEEAGAIGGVKPQAVQGLPAQVQRKHQHLPQVAHDARSDDLLVFGEALPGIQVQLRGEQRVGRSCGMFHLVGRVSSRLGHHDQLVGGGVGLNQHVPRHRRWQLVERDAEFRLVQRPVHGFQALDAPPFGRQQALDGSPREKTQVCAVQQPFFPVREVAQQQLGHQTGVRRVGN